MVVHRNLYVPLALPLIPHRTYQMRPAALTEVMAETFRGTEFDTGFDQKLLGEIADYFRPIREKYLANGLMSPKVLGVNIKTLMYQVPGGMLSNLVSQLEQQGF